MTEPDLEQAYVLAVVKDPHYKPVKPRADAKKLGLDEDANPMVSAQASGQAVDQTLASCDRPPVISYWRAVAAPLAPNRKGTTTASPASFARPTQATVSCGRRAAAPGRRSQAGYLHRGQRRWRCYFLTGDTVLVRLKASRDTHRPLNPEGEIALPRSSSGKTHQFVLWHRISNRPGRLFVVLDGKYGRSAGRSRSAIREPRTHGPDDKVVIEMIRFPSHYQDGEGVITEVLGACGTPGVDTISIIREFGLPEACAADALDEARIEAEKFDESIPPGRTDLTGEVIITIDPIDARDFDDAISLVQIDRGHWRAGSAAILPTHRTMYGRGRCNFDRRGRSAAPASICPPACCRWRCPG